MRREEKEEESQGKEGLVGIEKGNTREEEKRDGGGRGKELGKDLAGRKRNVREG